jgi:hypothetical protein
MNADSLFIQVIERFYAYGAVGFWAALLLAVALSAVLAWLFIAAIRQRTRFYLPLFGLIAAATAVAVFVQSDSYRQQHEDRNLGSIGLLPGYSIQHRYGSDTYIGTISRPDGLRIGIDIGALAGLGANPAEPEKHKWVYEQKVRGHTVFVGMRASGESEEETMLCVTFPQGVVNFYAAVASDRDIAEMLSMVLTYEPIGTER